MTIGLFKYEGKLLLREGKIAIDARCCCRKVYQPADCYVVCFNGLSSQCPHESVTTLCQNVSGENSVWYGLLILHCSTGQPPPNPPDFTIPFGFYLTHNQDGTWSIDVNTGYLSATGTSGDNPTLVTWTANYGTVTVTECNS